MGDLEGMSVDIKALQRRRDRFVEALRSYGYDLHSPEGTFYLLPTSPDPDDVAFVERLARTRCTSCPGPSSRCPGASASRSPANDEMTERALPIFERAAKA